MPFIDNLRFIVNSRAVRKIVLLKSLHIALVLQKLKFCAVAQVRGGRYGKNVLFLFFSRNITIPDFITIICHVCFTIFHNARALQPN